jgi:hypothetical protein
MLLLLTILSVLALWSLLARLIVGLLLIRKTLESVRITLERIAMGVRAIEKETEPLGPQALNFVHAGPVHRHRHFPRVAFVRSVHAMHDPGPHRPACADAGDQYMCVRDDVTEVTEEAETEITVATV